MTKARILVVDDSAVIRRLVSKALAADPALEVAGIAANGKIALAKIPQVNPDLITLDVEMPVMDGLETLTEIRKIYKDLPVIMFSSLTERAASATLEALKRGASDYVTKPSQMRDINAALQQVREELIPKVRALCPFLKEPKREESRLSAMPGKGLKKVVARPAASFAKRIDILAIGVSTGGPNALAKLIPNFPADFPVPIVIVQHMPPTFTGLLANSLSKNSRLPVREGFEGALLEPGTVWIAPGNYHMTIEGNPIVRTLELNQDSQENSCRPAVDVLFRSVADVYGGNTLGVILTGMGKDGLRGCENILSKGGRVIVQDEETSIVWGMPGYVAEAGLAEKILPLEQIAPTIIRTVIKSMKFHFKKQSSIQNNFFIF